MVLHRFSCGGGHGHFRFAEVPTWADSCFSLNHNLTRSKLFVGDSKRRQR
ncbi:hypothetical protein MtrunA17_Chr5g0445031 [Medicago truncatula]|uniref:Uncharacterized protein n=1 Tax=Medicago truncatula TaxID=3880 RepID=A0A396HZE4_MEDTR|nr:hypothetical protein MtrunA17_Chr5g0445031 [Medicago truncatula]